MENTNYGEFIDSATARKNVSAYLNDTGKMQPAPEQSDHVIGHVLGLAKMKELIANIDHHNKTEKDASKHVTGLRFYNSKSVRKGKESGGHVRDLTVVPVTDNGHDFPEKIHHGSASAHSSAPSAPKFILADTRPCPNQC
jgi:hypothetical protein